MVYCGLAGPELPGTVIRCLNSQTALCTDRSCGETGSKLKTTLHAQYATFFVLRFRICTFISCYIIHAVSLFWQLRQLRPVACKEVHSHDPVACKALKALKALQGSQGIEDTLHTSKRRRHGILTNL